VKKQDSESRPTSNPQRHDAESEGSLGTDDTLSPTDPSGPKSGLKETAKD
jgi:hypothetical protein